MHRSRLAALSGLAAAAVLAAACGGSGSSPTASAATSQAPSAEATRVEVRLTDAMRIEPAQLTVPAGVPVTFVVTNAGTVEHEFVLGDEEVQAEHEEEMSGGGHDMGDDGNAVTVAPGATEEHVYTFSEPGVTLAGCHVPGHYPAGMKAEITVE